MTDKTDVMRGEFEAWAVSEGFDVTRDKTIGQYSDFAVESRWVVWKAALQSVRPPALVSDGEVLIAIERGEGYEDVHPELVAEDCMSSASERGWRYRVLSTPTAPTKD